MKGPVRFDVVLAGVGGQGVLSLGGLVARAAHDAGLWTKQSEIHGMSQRGGAVQAFLRIADRPVRSDRVALGTAQVVLGLEPVEALRQLELLAPDGVLITAGEPVRNLPDYPDLAEVLAEVRALPLGIVVPAEELARGAGSVKGVNAVMLGAAAPFLPIEEERLREELGRTFASKGEAVVAANLRAFQAGRHAVTEAMLEPLTAGAPCKAP